MGRRDGAPIWIHEGQTTQALRRADLSPGRESGSYDEAWLQHLLYDRPEVFPVDQIESGFGQLVPVCRELSLTFGAGRSGALDNLFMTSTGGLVLVEAKLWRNPEARRSVVAQAMEYAAAVFRLSYEDLQTAVRRARSVDSLSRESLYEIVSEHAEELDEVGFVDAVTRNLRRGRAIVAVVGDGIREDIIPLAELLQTHAGQRFTFALVELAVYTTPVSDIRLVVPSVLAQTALIERGVVQIEDGGGSSSRIVVKDVPVRPIGSSSPRSMSIGEDEFFELLGQRDPALPSLLKNFLSKAETIGIFPDRQGGLNLKHASPSGNALNLGTISKEGFLDTGPATWWGRKLGHIYNESLARLIGGSVREIKGGQESALRTANGKTPRLSDLLPAHEEAWLDAMKLYVEGIFEEADA